MSNCNYNFSEREVTTNKFFENNNTLTDNFIHNKKSSKIIKKKTLKESNKNLNTENKYNKTPEKKHVNFYNNITINNNIIQTEFAKPALKYFDDEIIQNIQPDNKIDYNSLLNISKSNSFDDDFSFKKNSNKNLPKKKNYSRQNSFRKKKFKTIVEKDNKMMKFFSKPESPNDSKNIINENDENDSKFHRKNKKYKTLVEKCKLGNSIFKEELKIKISNQTLIDEQTGDPKLKYKIIKTLGDGSFGIVFCAINIQTGMKIAMKQIEKLKENVVDDLEIKNEINILKKLDHPNIVKIYEFYNTKKNYFLITEYYKYGELYNYLKYSYNETQIAVLFYQVFSGLCYLHENNILHRDLKLENIMISDIEKDINTGVDYFWIKIIDFGTAKIFKKSKNEKAVVGSSYYIAPEVLKQKYNEKCDTWSIGVIMYMIIVGKAPFDGENDEEILENIKTGVYNYKHKKLLSTSKECQDLVSKLLEVDTKKRLSAKEALNHIFFKNFHGRKLFSNFKMKEIDVYLNNLLNYKFQSKFQQLVLAFIVHNIPFTNETKNILKLFLLFNKSGNCKLTKIELIEGLCNYKEKEEIEKVIDDIFLLLDGDNNGFIEFEEFLRACIDKKKILNNETLEYAFKFLDKDNSHILTVNKIIKAFVNKKNKTLEEIFKNTIKEVDKDNDGKINFNEFKQLMLNVQ